MNDSLLAFAVGLHRRAFGQHAENTAAMDWFVLATLGFLFFLLGCFATWAWLLWRRGQRPEPHVQLLMELEEEAQAEPAADTETQRPEANGGAPKEAGEPWELPPDWWKKK